MPQLVPLPLNPRSYVSGDAVTPNDSTDLARTARALWVGGAGAVSFIAQDGATVTLSGVAAGTILPVVATRVKAAGTTATNIVALI